MIGSNFFKETFIHNGNEYRGQKNTGKGDVMIPLQSNDCPFNVGDIITQKIGSGSRDFEIEDYDVKTSLGVFSSNHSFMAYLNVKALDTKPKPPHSTSITFNGPIHTAGDFQAGSVNTISKDVTFNQVADAIAKSDDPEVKGLWEKMTTNPSFLAILSAVASGVSGS